MTGMLSELQNMRQEINLIHNSSLRAKCQNLLQQTDDRIRQGFVACKKMKDNLIRSAADAMKAFREKGKDALASSVRAMKIPEVLDKVADDKLLEIKGTKAFSSLPLNLKRISIAFWMWYNSESKSEQYHDFSESNVDKLISEWDA